MQREEKVIEASSMN